MIAYEARARQRLDGVDSRESELLRLTAAIETASAAVAKAGKVLSAKRKKAAPALAKEIASHLSDLGFNQSIFEIEIETLPEPDRAGSRAWTSSLPRTPANRPSRSVSSLRAEKCRG